MSTRIRQAAVLVAAALAAIVVSACTEQSAEAGERPSKPYGSAYALAEAIGCPDIEPLASAAQTAATCESGALATYVYATKAQRDESAARLRQTYRLLQLRSVFVEGNGWLVDCTSSERHPCDQVRRMVGGKLSEDRP